MGIGNGLTTLGELRERVHAIEDDVKSHEREIGRLDARHDAILDRVDNHLEDSARSEGEIRVELAALRTDVKWIREALETRKTQASFLGVKGPFGLDFQARNVTPWILLALVVVLGLAVWLSR